MKTIEEKFPAGKYARVHKSFIVMIDKINSIRNESLKIRETEIPVSRFYRDNFFKVVNEKNIKKE